MGCKAAELVTTKHLHDQVAIATRSGLTAVTISTAHLAESLPRGIPHLLCEGCDATIGSMLHENEGATGAWSVGYSASTIIEHQLGPFTSIPKTACANCELSTPTHELAYAKATLPHQGDTRNKRTIVLGGGREENEQLAGASNPDRPWIRTAHLVQPLAAAQSLLVAEALQEDTSHNLATASSPSWLALVSENVACKGVECQPVIGDLTDGHATVALAAFDGTTYQSIDDLKHKSPLSCTDLSSTDPSFYCDKATMGIALAETGAVVLEGASKAFLKLAREARQVSSGVVQDLARAAPDPKSWGLTPKVVPVEQPPSQVYTAPPTANSHMATSILEQQPDEKLNKIQVAKIDDRPKVITKNLGQIVAALPEAKAEIQEKIIDYDLSQIIAALTPKQIEAKETRVAKVDNRPKVITKHLGQIVDALPEAKVEIQDIQVAKIDHRPKVLGKDLGQIVASLPEAKVEIQDIQVAKVNKAPKLTIPTLSEVAVALPAEKIKAQEIPVVKIDHRPKVLGKDLGQIVASLPDQPVPAAPVISSRPSEKAKPTSRLVSLAIDESNLVTAAQRLPEQKSAVAKVDDRPKILAEELKQFMTGLSEQPVTHPQNLFTARQTEKPKAATRLVSLAIDESNLIAASTSQQIPQQKSSPSFDMVPSGHPRVYQHLALQEKRLSGGVEARSFGENLEESSSAHFGIATNVDDVGARALMAVHDFNPQSAQAGSTVGGEALTMPSDQTGMALSKDATCMGDCYTPAIAGEKGKPAVDATQIKLITASVQPQDPQAKARHPDFWLASPGPGSQTITAHGKVPGGYDITSGKVGASGPVTIEEITAPVHNLGDGYHYYLGEEANTTFASTSEPVKANTWVKKSPGTASNAPWEGLSADGLGHDRLGVKEAQPQHQTTALAFAPNVDSAWGVDARALRPEKKSQAVVALNSESDANGYQPHAPADCRMGKANKVVKVVHVDSPSKKTTTIGKVSSAERDLTSIDPYAAHRFSVEVVPHVDKEDTSNIHLLVGRASPRSSQASNQRDSFFIDYAHASESEVGAGRETASFFSVGAPIYPIAERNWEEETASKYTVGAVSSDEDENDDDYYTTETTAISAPEGEPGLDSFGRKPTALGVRREGHLWNDNRPWFDEEESQRPLAQSDVYERQSYRYDNQRPPDKPDEAPDNRGNPVASAGASANHERELDSSLQKKNRTLEFEYQERQEGDSSVSADPTTNVSSAEIAEANEQANQQFNERGDSFIAGWEIEQPKTLASTPSFRELIVEAPLNTTIAQETLFDSGIPAKPPEKAEPVIQSVDTKKDTTLPDESHEQEGLLINFRDVAITEYIRFVAQQTGRNFVFNDKDLQFNITIISEQPTSLDNIVAALLQELRIHGLQVIEQGNSIIIHANDKTKGPTRVLKGDQVDNHETQLVTRVFQLDSIPADKMKGVVTPMLSAQALVQVLPDTNNLLITDFGMNVEKIADLIRTLDKPTTAFQIGQYVGRNNFIENLIPLAEEIIKPFSDKHQIVFVPHLSTNSVFIVSSPILVKRAIGILEQLDSLEGATKILTLEDLSKGGTDLVNRKPEDHVEGQLIKLKKQQEEEEDRKAREETHAAAKNLTKDGQKHPDVDVSSKATVAPPPKLPEDHISQTKFYIHKLQYRRGDQLTSALTGIGDSLRMSEKANIDLINAIGSIQWIESSNSLIVTGTPEGLIRVRELIEEVDIPMRQVFLEMLILDTTIQDSLTYGVDFTSQFGGYQLGGSQAWLGETPASGSTSPLLTSVNNAGAFPTGSTSATSVVPSIINATALAAAGSVPGYNIGIIGRRILRDGTFYNTMGALVQAVHQDTETEILLNPKIMVEDNNEAEIFVGQNIAFQTQNVVNDAGSVISQNVEFRDVGTTLRVRAQIGNNNIVTLDIREEVSNVSSVQSGTVGSAGSGGGGSTGSATTSPGPTTQTSRTVTRVHVPNEYFCILSGLIQDQRIHKRVQLPCLGGLPIIGALASRIDPSTAKRNLMIFIRPIIIDTEWDFDNITKRQEKIYKDKGKMKPRWKYEADEGLDFLNLPRINEHCEDENYLPGWGNDCD